MAFEGFSTLTAIAKELEMHKRTIFRLEEEGKICLRRVKGKIYVKRAELIELLEKSCKGCKWKIILFINAVFVGLGT